MNNNPFGVKLDVKINPLTKDISAGSIFEGTIKKIASQYNERTYALSVDTGTKLADNFKHIANRTYWWHDHPYHTGNLTESWKVTNSAFLQWEIKNTATNSLNASIAGRNVHYIADLETIWNKPFVEQASDIFGKQAHETFKSELRRL